MNNLFKQHIKNCANNITELTSAKSDQIIALLECMFPFGFSQIDWDKIETKLVINPEAQQLSVSIIETLLAKPIANKSVYIIWDNAALPVVVSNLDNALEHIWALSCIDFKTWFFNPIEGFVIEWISCGNKTIGIATGKHIALCNAWKNCLDKLENNVIMTKDDSNNTRKLLKNKFGYGKNIVDWSIIKENLSGNITNSADLLNMLTKLVPTIRDEPVYLIMNNNQLPVLETSLTLAIKNWNILTQVDQLMWILNVSTTYLIQISRPNNIKIGLTPIRSN